MDIVRELKHVVVPSVLEAVLVTVIAIYGVNAVAGTSQGWIAQIPASLTVPFVVALFVALLIKTLAVEYISPLQKLMAPAYK